MWASMDVNAGLWRWAIQANRKRELGRELATARRALQRALKLADSIDELSPDFPRFAAAGLAEQGLHAGWSSAYVEENRHRLEEEFQRAVDARRAPLVAAVNSLDVVSRAVESLLLRLQPQDGWGPSLAGEQKKPAREYLCIAAAAGAARWCDRAPELAERVTGTLLAYAAIAVQLEPVPPDDPAWMRRRPAWAARLSQARAPGRKKHPLLTVRGKIPLEQRRQIPVTIPMAVLKQAKELIAAGSEARAWDLLAYFTPWQMFRSWAREKVRGRW